MKKGSSAAMLRYTNNSYHSLRNWKIFDSTFVNRYNCRHRLLCNKAAQKSYETDPKSTYNQSATRKSPLNIQMLSNSLYRQIFKETNTISSNSSENDLNRIQKHLERFDLWNKQTTCVPEVDFKLPDLQGENIDEHFRNIAHKQSAPYLELAEDLASFELPPKPKQWEFREGWTRYGRDGSVTEVPYPDDDALVFDVEILMKTKYYPTMATAASTNAWFSWCSKRLTNNYRNSDKVNLRDMIPMETPSHQHQNSEGSWKAKLVIGHNVGFDRSFIKEQYYIKGTRLRFMDTMSMHIALRGMTGDQRMLYMARTKGSLRKEVREIEERAAKYREEMVFKWTQESSMNNLNDVYQLHCNAQPLQKSKRDVFVQGNMTDVREQFQELMAYCAQDVAATHKVFQVLWPSLKERFPHPVTIAGMLEMGTTYLPVNSRWFEYVNRANEMYSNLQREVRETLMSVADEACSLLHDDSYREDPWLWDEDWSVRHEKKKKVPPKKLKQLEKEIEDPIERQKIIHGLSTPKKPVHMPGKPRWYADLCPRERELKEYPERNRPCKLSTQRRITHKLLRLMWEGYPMHYDNKYGWGYLVPGREISDIDLELIRQDHDSSILPFKQVYEVCRPVLNKLLFAAEIPDHEIRQILQKDLSVNEDLWEIWKNIPKKPEKKKKKKTDWSKIEGPWYHKGDGPYDVDTPGCYFFRIPRGDSDDRNVSNPLSKHFLNRVEEGVLTSFSGSNANRVLLINMNCSYWKNSMDRIGSQLVVALDDNAIPETTRRSLQLFDGGFVGAILPRLVVAGTVTRRAVEGTWLTASNAYPNRVGSELKAMIQSPPGYHFVGADVDSQELWIAALLGDAAFAGQHGCTALGWMTLQGNKSEGTDLHSKTANLIGISRDQAKVFNYGRIYGAGQRFAQKLLRDFNHRITKEEASTKAKKLYLETKGKRYLEDSYSEDEVTKVSVWKGGSESYMFNELEAIAKSNHPKTPVLGCRISQVLEPEKVSSMFMTSRINWVVQSSAVDYLHLMLVSMRWLIEEYNIDGRFCISIHDEVRYLVNSDDRYRAALALQITNLLTRCMFAYKLNFHDLPQCVAFFSGVDIDTCLRKETHLDCKTPSNPAGIRTAYNIPEGDTHDIYSILELTNSSLVKSKQPKQSLNQNQIDDLDAADLMV